MYKAGTNKRFSLMAHSCRQLRRRWCPIFLLDHTNPASWSTVFISPLKWHPYKLRFDISSEYIIFKISRLINRYLPDSNSVRLLLSQLASPYCDQLGKRRATAHVQQGRRATTYALYAKHIDSRGKVIDRTNTNQNRWELTSLRESAYRWCVCERETRASAV